MRAERAALNPVPRSLARPAAQQLPKLPAETTPFIGRRQTIEAIKARIHSNGVRLLTLTGPGGIGKSRLALRVAGELIEDFADGVLLVQLAPINDSNQVAAAIAQPLGVRETWGRPLMQGLTERLRAMELLLVLDNFEHLLAAAALVAGLLESCPELCILITSRTLLRLTREHVFDVPPMEAPNPQQLPDLAEIGRYDAVRLFLERAQSVQAGVELTAENASAVVGVCHRLDGLPLAIELAAARVRLLPPAGLLGQLSNRLGFLTGGARDAPVRHQTLRNAIAWSYDLLADSEQQLFRRLAVFAGGFTLEAAAAVAKPQEYPGYAIFDEVAALVDQSLLRQIDGEPSEPRFGLLETLREYALERLVANHEDGRARERHAAYFQRLAEAAEPQLRGPLQKDWLMRLEREHDNLRAALHWCLEHADGEQCQRFAGSLWRFWQMRGNMRDGRAILSQALALGGAALQSDSAKAARAVASLGAGALAYFQGDFMAARLHCEESLALQRSLGNPPGIATSLNNLANAVQALGSDAEARSLYAESLTIRRQLDDRPGIAASLHNLANLAARKDDRAEARALFEEVLGLQRELGDRQGTARSALNLARVTKAQEDYARAWSLLEESLSIGQELGDRLTIASALSEQGDIAFLRGDYSAARSLHEDSLAIKLELGDRMGIARSLFGLAGMAAAQGQAVRASRLVGAATALRLSLGAPLSPAERAQSDGWLRPATRELSSVARVTAVTQGAAMSLEEAIAYALEQAERVAAASTNQGARGEHGPLTQREREVSALLAQGRSNREIAVRLVIAESTAQRHVANIMAKLGFDSRTQVGVWAAQHGLAAAPEPERSSATLRRQ
jgi:predicted ATPase/DNA-binding CsgD family transcriptional regulator